MQLTREQLIGQYTSSKRMDWEILFYLHTGPETRRMFFSWWRDILYTVDWLINNMSENNMSCPVQGRTIVYSAGMLVLAWLGFIFCVCSQLSGVLFYFVFSTTFRLHISWGILFSTELVTNNTFKMKSVSSQNFRNLTKIMLTKLHRFTYF